MFAELYDLDFIDKIIVLMCIFLFSSLSGILI